MCCSVNHWSYDKNNVVGLALMGFFYVVVNVIGCGTRKVSAFQIVFITLKVPIISISSGVPNYTDYGRNGFLETGY